MKIESVLIYPNEHRPVSDADFARVRDELQKLHCRLSTTDRAHASETVAYEPPETAFAHCDAAITLGGDGTILAAAHYAKETNTPLLGINFGTLGYMSELEVGECGLLSGLRDAKIEERMLLDVDLFDRNGVLTGKGLALNEVSICREKPGTMIRLTLCCDGTPVSSYRADGMLVSTPTGSTAYNLSAGGPIIDPKMNALCVCPLAPHTLSAIRPIVFSPDAELEITAEGNAAAAADSTMMNVPAGFCRLRVRRSAQVIRLLKLKHAGFCEVLMNKMTVPKQEREDKR